MECLWKDVQHLFVAMLLGLLEDFFVFDILVPVEFFVKINHNKQAKNPNLEVLDEERPFRARAVK